MNIFLDIGYATTVYGWFPSLIKTFLCGPTAENRVNNCFDQIFLAPKRGATWNISFEMVLVSVAF